MALFLIERNFAEAVEASTEGVLKTLAINDDVGVQWIYSFLSADKRKSYCLYEAPDEATIREASQRAGVPADAIIAVDKFDPAEYLAS